MAVGSSGASTSAAKDCQFRTRWGVGAGGARLSFQNGNKLLPRADFRAILFSHDPDDLTQVPQIVRGPCSEQLPQGYLAELGVSALEIELFGG